MVKVNKICGLVVAVFLFLVLTANTSEALVPVWSYKFEGITSCATSPNGEFVILCTENYEVYLIDKYGSPLLSIRLPNSVEKSLVSNSGYFVVNIGNKALYYDKNGGVIWEYLGQVCDIDITSNGEYVALGSNNRLCLYRREKGLIIDRNLKASITHVCISEKADMLLAATGNKISFLRLYQENTEKIQGECELKSMITSLTVSEGGEYSAIGTGEGEICLFSGFDEVLKEEIKSRVNSIEITSDGSLLIGAESGLYLFSIEKRLWSCRGLGSVKDVSLSDNQELLALGNDRGEVFIMDKEGRRFWTYKLRNPIIEVGISSEGNYLVASSSSEILCFRLFDWSIKSTNFNPYASRRYVKNFDLKEKFSISLEAEDFWIGDINNDGKNEIVLIDHGKLMALDATGETIWEKRLTGSESEKARIDCLVDVDRDFMQEIVVSPTQDSSRLEIYNDKGHLIKAFDFRRSLNENWKIAPDSNISIPTKIITDLNGDHKLEILLIVRAECETGPKGIVAFDYETQEELWSYPIPDISILDNCPWGKYPYVGGIADFDGDGSSEIVVGAPASENGNSHCRVIVLDCNGKDRLTREVSESCPGVNIGIDDVDNDGHFEIVGAIFHANNAAGELFVLDSQGNLRSSIEFDCSLIWGGIADFDEDCYKEIIVGDSQGHLTMYDYNLNKLKEEMIASPGRIVHPAIIADINGDGAKEIIVTTEDSDVIMLDQNFDILWRKHFDDTDHIHLPVVKSLNTGSCVDSFLVLADKLYLYSAEEDFQSGIPDDNIRLLKAQQEIDFCRDVAERASKRGDLSLSREYYVRMYDLCKDLDCRRETLGILKEIDVSLEAEDLLIVGRDYLEEGDCQEAKKKLQLALEGFENMGNIQKREEVLSLIQRCDDCESGLERINETQELISKADNYLEAAGNEKLAHNFREANNDITLALQKYDEGAKECEQALGIFKESKVPGRVQQTESYLEEINLKRGKAETELRSIQHDFRIWLFAIIVWFTVFCIWVFLLSKSYKPILAKLRGKNIEDTAYAMDQQLKDLRDWKIIVSLVILIFCAFIILGRNSFLLMFIIALFTVIPPIYSLLPSRSEGREGPSVAILRECMLFEILLQKLSIPPNELDIIFDAVCGMSYQDFLNLKATARESYLGKISSKSSIPAVFDMLEREGILEKLRIHDFENSEINSFFEYLAKQIVDAEVDTGSNLFRFIERSYQDICNLIISSNYSQLPLTGNQKTILHVFNLLDLFLLNENFSMKLPREAILQIAKFISVNYEDNEASTIFDQFMRKTEVQETRETTICWLEEEIAHLIAESLKKFCSNQLIHDFEHSEISPEALLDALSCNGVIRFLNSLYRGTPVPRNAEVDDQLRKVNERLCILERIKKEKYKQGYRVSGIGSLIEINGDMVEAILSSER
jgi:WD40 repeat protein/tetratricopeptide (TPR) repeat protein